MIVVQPEADLVARLDPELVSQCLWYDNLTFGADTVSHTYKYNLRYSLGAARAST